MMTDGLCLRLIGAGNSGQPIRWGGPSIVEFPLLQTAPASKDNDTRPGPYRKLYDGDGQRASHD